MILAGIWLDSAHATLVQIVDGEPTTDHYESRVEARHRSTHGSPAPTEFGAQYDANERVTREQQHHDLAAYFAELIEALKPADAILVLGPGETKKHFGKELKNSRETAKKLREVQTADSMTEAQLIEKVLTYYGLPPRRIQHGDPNY